MPPDHNFSTHDFVIAFHWTHTGKSYYLKCRNCGTLFIGTPDDRAAPAYPECGEVA